MPFYYVNFLPADTAATDAHVIFEIWNPHATRPITLYEVGYFAVGTPGAGMGFVTRRSTAKGTSGSTITPTIEHAKNREIAPDSQFTVELAAFSGQPTLASGELLPAWVSPAIAGSGLILPIPRGIVIPAGQGLCLCNRTNVIFQDGEWSIVVED